MCSSKVKVSVIIIIITFCIVSINYASTTSLSSLTISDEPVNNYLRQNDGHSNGFRSIDQRVSSEFQSDEQVRTDKGNSNKPNKKGGSKKSKNGNRSQKKGRGNRKGRGGGGDENSKSGRSQRQKASKNGKAFHKHLRTYMLYTGYIFSPLIGVLVLLLLQCPTWLIMISKLPFLERSCILTG